MTRVIAGAAGGRRLAVPRGTATRPTSDRAREGLFSSVASELGGLDGKRVLDLYAGSGAVGLEALSRGATHVLLVESDARAAAIIRANIAAVGLPGATVVTDRVERLLARPPRRSGADKDEADKDEAVKDEAVKDGADKDEAVKDGADKDGADKDGAVKDGADKDGPDKDGTERNGTERDGTESARDDPADGYDLAFADPPYAVTDEAVTRVLARLAAGWLADGALVVIERATRSGALDWPPGFLHGKSRRYGEATFWYGWFDNDAGAGPAGQLPVTVSRSGVDAPGGAHEE